MNQKHPALIESDFDLIANQMHDGLYLLNNNREITYWNQAAESITGYAAHEVLGKKCSDNILVHIDAQGRQMCLGMCPAESTINDGQKRQAEVFLKHKEGHRVPVDVRVSPLKDKQGEIVGAIELFSESSPSGDLQQRLQKLEQLALVDDLTGLPNRRYLNSELQSQMNMFRREEIPFGLLYIDIDHFKDFNDRYGHQTGDRVMENLSKSLSGAVRSFDTIGRWGGEEFLGIFPNTRLPELQTTGERLISIIRHIQVPHREKNLKITVTIGGAIVRKDDTQESLIERADRRLYRGKESGRDRLILRD